MNIILIGMPGCGKTTIGKLAAERLKYKFADLDDEIVKTSGKSINNIFADSGEDYFRELESNVLNIALKENNAVISTGGGIVKLSRNIESLKESDSCTVFIDRPPELIIGDIDTSERPLLKDGADRLKNLYKERYELYKAVADIIIKNDTSLSDIVNKVCEII